MRTHALLLNADYTPILLIEWERALVLLLEEKVDLVTGYAEEAVRTVSRVFEKPAVVRLRAYMPVRNRFRFNRQNVLARDSYTCAYCGAHPEKHGKPCLEELTLDHVVPRARAKEGRVFLPWANKTVPVTCWENIVTACEGCNIRKADKTLEQSGLVLRKYPKAPTAMDVLRVSLTRHRIPEEWVEYLPEGHEWRGYWTDELEDS